MTEGGWSFQVERIPLDGLSIDAGQRLGMVIVQPDYALDADGTVPFRISAAYRQAQQYLIERAFQIRAVESQDRGVPVSFIVFPEAAVPAHDPDGLDCLRQQMEQAEGEVVFVGGLEGLNPQEAGDLADRFAPGFDGAKPDFDAAGAFVNVCVIAVKWADGRLGWHFQAKLAPSHWEQGQSMARGKRVLYFDAPHVKFLCQICFDHIAAQGHEPLSSALCDKLIEKIHPNTATLDFVFVPQFNPQPNHPSVRQNTGLLLNQRDRELKNDMMALVFANKAAAVQEPSEYGRSGFHYRAGRWRPSTDDIGPKGYELYESDSVTSAVFRKRTQAIHVATLVPPGHNVGDSRNPRQPLDNPRSYLVADGCDPVSCSCLPGTAGSAGTFVECDCLPCKLRDTMLRNLPNTDTRNRWTGPDASQSALLASRYDEIRQRLLVLRCARARDLLNLLFLHREGGTRNPDMWIESVEMDAVCELAAAMSVLCARGQVEFDAEPQWTATLGSAVAVVVLDGENASNCQDLGARYLQQYETYRAGARSRPVLIVALRSTGRVEPIVARFQPRVDKSRRRGPFTGTSPYDEAARVRAFLCRDDLFQEARRALSLGDYLATALGGIGA